MIIELTTLQVREDSIEDFHVALPEALQIIQCAEGYLQHNLDRCDEDPCRYYLTVQWKTKEEAIDRFRESGRMKEIRYLLSWFYDEPPKSSYHGDSHLKVLNERMTQITDPNGNGHETSIALC